MLPLRPKLTVLLILLCFFLSACQVSAVNEGSAQSPAPDLPAPPTLILPTQTLAEPAPAIAPSPTAADNLNQSFADLKSELIDGVDWYILIQGDNQNETLFEMNPNTAFPPASMIKIPTALAVLSILEDQGRSLENLKTTGINGRNFDSLLEAMVIHSEESATDALEYFARGDNQLRKKLDGWGLNNTKYDPRTSTASELLTSLKLLNIGSVLNEEYTQYLLGLMGAYTENDQILLGKLNDELPGCAFFNKRGTMLNPTIVSDMGILSCGERSWYLVVAGTPAVDSTATFEDIQASIEDFAVAFANLVK